ncbi:phospholipid/cholesterol/gamma-HCH transport system substrate-binding protein [Alkalispirochaeta americana]|uniref:Phospholipid/cholesterol/gamma-HCH transport system substrate-binding protein n=1 Tax=Alkalispirochaeta americana TaxID=159291 RepID=A0A1N6QTK2_9SPIO|nr:MlaD family protein [Alkalispirochaeta americana]SIQ19895.1 phospholipid/cholesterol/gamma-HCH transport system substrate-binding protein [Alkalispirochaeta americana]
MKFRIRFAQQVVGVFSLIALVSIVGIIVAMGANQRWFARNYEFYSLFPTAEGLSVGMSIRYKGFPIGRITDIALGEEDYVRVYFYVQDTYKDRVRPNSVLHLVASPLGLGSTLMFYQGRGETGSLPEHSMVPAINSSMGQELVQRGLVQIPPATDEMARIMAQIEPSLRSMTELMTSLDQTMHHVNLALAGETTEPLGQTLAQTITLLAELEETLTATREPTLDILGSTAVITGNLEQTTEALQDPTGLIPRLLDADGSITTFLRDENRIFNEIEDILKSINASLAEVNELAIFANQSQPQIAGILEESRETLGITQDVLEGLSNNPLIRRGIPPELPQPSTFRSHRDAQF